MLFPWFLKASFHNTGKCMILSEVIPWTHKHFTAFCMSNYHILKITQQVSLMCEKRLLISVFVWVRHTVGSDLRNQKSWISYEVCSPEVVSVDLLPRFFCFFFWITESVHRKYFMTISGLARWRLDITFAWLKTTFIWKPRLFLCWYWLWDNAVKFLCAWIILFGPCGTL